MRRMPSDDASEELRELGVWQCMGRTHRTEYWKQETDRDLDVEYRSGELTLFENDCATLFEQRIGAPSDGYLSDEETTVYLFEIHRAVLAGTLGELRVPTLHEARRHPMFIKGLAPDYVVGMHCTKPVSGLAPPTNSNDRRRRRKAGLHDHDHRCFVTVPAMDVAAWIEANPEQHMRFRVAEPRTWAEYERGQRTIVDGSNVRSW